jgi:hypothetical protein
VLVAADDDGALGEGAVAASAVQRAAQQEPAGDQQDRADQEGDDEELAGELELREVAADAEQRRREQAGIDDRLVLVGTGAEDAAVVAATERDQGDPAEDQRALPAQRTRQGGPSVGDTPGPDSEDDEVVAAVGGQYDGGGDQREIEHERCQRRALRRDCGCAEAQPTARVRSGAMPIGFPSTTPERPHAPLPRVTG